MLLDKIRQKALMKAVLLTKIMDSAIFFLFICGWGQPAPEVGWGNRTPLPKAPKPFDQIATKRAYCHFQHMIREHRYYSFLSYTVKSSSHFLKDDCLQTMVFSSCHNCKIQFPHFCSRNIKKFLTSLFHCKQISC